MSEAQEKENAVSEQKPEENGYTAGIILVVIGSVALLAPYIDWNLLLLSALGAGFLVWGAVQREAGLIIPGGILTGLGAGVLVNAWVSGGYFSASGDVSAAIYLLCFAGGWGLITLFTKLFTDETHYWPLIPGGIMAALGASLLAGDSAMALLRSLQHWWPLALILLGVYLLVREWRRKHPKSESDAVE